MRLTRLVERLDDRLDVADYEDVDASANGLQVGPDDAAVDHVAFAVDAAVETAEVAAGHGADALVAHHGIVWGGLDDVTGIEYGRVSTLVEHDVALYAAHLPLDGHPELGNAAGLLGRLDATDAGAFGHVGGQPVGRRGRLPAPTTTADLRDRLAGALPVDAADVDVLDHGPDRLEDVAVLTGAGADFLREAADAGVDALVTGEGAQKLYHEAREAGVTVFLAGHYATETVGVRTLQSLVDGWGPDTTFIEAPTGL